MPVHQDLTEALIRLEQAKEEKQYDTRRQVGFAERVVLRLLLFTTAVIGGTIARIWIWLFGNSLLGAPAHLLLFISGANFLRRLNDEIRADNKRIKILKDDIGFLDEAIAIYTKMERQEGKKPTASGFDSTHLLSIESGNLNAVVTRGLARRAKENFARRKT